MNDANDYYADDERGESFDDDPARFIAQKPFAEGQYVDIDGVEGTVKSIGLLTTELISPDNKKIVVPNSKITSACITNFSAKPTRRIDWEF